MNFHRSYSVKEVEDLVHQMHSSYISLRSRSTYQESDFAHSLKSLLTTCTSISVILLQRNQTLQARFFLDTAVSVEPDFSRLGSFIERAWPGRILLYNTLAYSYYKQTLWPECLKTLHYAQTLSVEFNETWTSGESDHSIVTNLITFLGLWQIGEYSEAEVYLESAKDLVTAIVHSKVPSKLSAICVQNIQGLLSVGTAAIAIKVHKNFKKAEKICILTLEKLPGEELLVRNTISKFLEDMRSNSLISKDFETVLFLSLFVPFIASNAPRITEETYIPKTKLTFTPVSPKPIQKPKPIRHKINPKHWWNNPKFIGNLFKNQSNLEKRPKTQSRHRIATKKNLSRAGTAYSRSRNASGRLRRTGFTDFPHKAHIHTPEFPAMTADAWFNPTLP